MLSFPEPEKTAILLQALVDVATDLILVPVKSSPLNGLVVVLSLPNIL